jgi:hydroxymethylglutaryl-CoA synthase
VETPSLSNFDYFLFHSPYTKLVQKAFGRLLFNDFLRQPEAQQFKGLSEFKVYSVDL